MRRIIALIALICLCLPVLASAEMSAAPVYTYEDVEWLSGTNLLIQRGDAGYGLHRLDGTALTEAVYYDAFTHAGGAIVAAKIIEGEETNAYGVLGMDGAEIVPFQYGDIEIANAHWAVCVKLTLSDANNYDYESWFSDDYYLIGSVDLYNLDEGVCVASLTREQYNDSYVYGKCILVEDRAGKVNAYDAQFNVIAEGLSSLYDTLALPEDQIAESDVPQLYYEEYGTFGLKDASGSVILEPTYDHIGDFKDGYAAIEENGKVGLIDAQGQVAVAPNYDKIMATSFARSEYGYDSQGYFAVVLGGKIGYVDEAGNVTVEPKYAEDAVEYRGMTCNYTDPVTGEFVILAADGNVAKAEVKNRISDGALDYSYGKYYKASDADYNYALIDWHGELVFPYAYDDFSLSGDGAYLMAEKDGVCEIYEVK